MGRSQHTRISCVIISCRSYKPYEEVAKYYKDIISGLTILQVYNNTEDSYHADAAVNDQDEVSIRVERELYEEYSDGVKCNVTLMYKKLKKAELPEGYRSDLLPVIGGSTLRASNESDEGYNGIRYTAQFITTKHYDEVVEFYKEIT
jgi:hypothetical protein